ncbi:MAG: hypothetical protein ABGW76_04940 [Mesonia sp.]|uniref:hypothetical protein n=1 Tax=Mesonia sp. TaxID=1960830 RepID=UPI003242F1F6
MATERVKIAEIDIGVDKITAKAGKARQEMFSLQKANRDLKKETNNLQSATQEQLDQYTKNEVGIKKYRKQISDSQKVLDAYINIQNQDIRTKQDARDANRQLIAIANQLDTTNADHAKTLDQVNAEIDRNNDFIKENASEYEKTKINIGNYEESIKNALSSTGLLGNEVSQVTNIYQNFAPVFNTVRAEFKQGADDIRNASAATEGMSKTQKLLTITTNASSGALKLFRAALIGTGIGAIVVVLGSLVAYLTSTQEGVDKVNRFLTPMKEIFSGLLGIVQNFGKEIFDAVSNPKKLIKDLGEMIKQNLINRFEALASIANKVLNFEFDGIGDDLLQAGTGVEDLTGKLAEAGSKAGDFFDEAYKRGQEIQKLTEDIEKAEINQALVRQQNTNILREQELIAKDRGKTDEERQAALEKAQEAQQNIVDYEANILEMKIKQLELQQQANDTSREEEKELQNLRAERLRLDEESRRVEMRFLGTKNQLENEAEARRKKAQQEEIQRQEELFNITVQRLNLEMEIFIARQGYAEKTKEQELEIAEEVYERQLEIERKKLEAGKITQQELYLFILQQENDLAKRRAEIAIDNAERELEAFKDNHLTKIEQGAFLNEQLFQQERDRLNNIAQAEREFQQKRFEEGLINQQDYNDEIARIDDENYKNQEKLRAEREQAKKEKQAFELELQREQEAEQFQNKFDLELAREQQRYEAELAAAERLGVDTTAIKDKHAKNQEEIEERKELAKVQMYGDSFGQIAKVLGEQTALGKSLNLAQALINTYTGITAALSLPFPANIAAAATTGATGFKAVKDITKTKVPKAAQGIAMDINGPSHSQGGSTFYDANGNPIVEAQGGEKMVILKREASRELDVLSKLNQKHGGVSLSKPVSYAANGGAVIRNPRTNIKPQKIDYSKMAEMVGSQVGMYVSENVNSIQTVVPVDQITDVATRAANVEQGADL